MAVLMTPFTFQFFDDNGAPLAGGKIYSYEAGTTTPKATYTDDTEATPNSNPVVLDSAGRCGDVWINGAYKFVLTNSVNSEIDTRDNVTSFGTLTTSTSSDTAPPLGNKIAPHEDLVIYRGSVTQLTISATSVVMKNAAGVRAKFDNISTTANITTSGAGGLDTGSEASSTWYYIWAIGKTDGTKSAVLSTSSSAPTLPSGYTYYGLLGAVYNNSSGDLVNFKQVGNKVMCAIQSPLSAGTATTYTSVSLAAYVPPIATSVDILIGNNSSSGSATTTTLIAPLGSGTTPTYGYYAERQQVSTTSSTYSSANILLHTAQTLYYYVSGANARGYIDLNGWSY